MPLSIRRAAVVGLVAAGASLSAACGGESSADGAKSSRTFAPISRAGDWLAQDYADSRGIPAVRANRGGLVATARLRGGDPHRGKGEVYTDLKYVFGLPSETLDLRGRSVRAVVDVPASFVGDPSAPNGVQVFVKDAALDSAYSKYMNVTRRGRHVVTLSGSSDVDLSKVRIIGVKFAIGRRSTDTFSGTLRVREVQIAPGLKIPAPPLANVAVPKPVFGGGVKLRDDGFHVAGGRRFLTGGNYTPIEYGQTIGTNGYFPAGNGISRHPNYIAASLGAFRKARAHVLRVPLAADGRTLLDARGRVRGYGARARADIRVLLRLAAANDQKVEFTLVDFLLAGRDKTDNGVLLRGRSEVFTDAPTRTAFFRDLVRPFLRAFGRHPGLFGIDCVNEPNWLVGKSEGGSWEAADPDARAVTPIPRAALDAYLAACAATVRDAAPGLPATAGTSAENLALTASAGDYTAVHHYPDMPLLSSFRADLPSARPWMLEEFPTSDTAYDKSRAGGGPAGLGAYLSSARSLGAAGALLWSLNPGADQQSFPAARLDARLRELRAWCEHEPGTLCD